MIRRIVLLTASLLLPLAVSAQPGDSLPAFRSDAELRHFLSELHVAPGRRTPPPPEPPCPPAAGDTVDSAAVVVQGRIINVMELPEPDVRVRIEAAGACATTGADGSYRLAIPAGRIPGGEAVQMRAARGGLNPEIRSVTLVAGREQTQDFRLGLEVIRMEDVMLPGDPAPPEYVSSGQHAEVDEGATIKRHGDHLLILKRGLLFTVRVGGGGLERVSITAAFGSGRGWNLTQDEMVVSGGEVVVAGYSAALGGTEIRRFTVGPEGAPRWRETYLLRPRDYRGSRHYAVRLFGTRLVTYAAVPARHADSIDGWMPALRRVRPPGGDDAARRTLPATRVHHPGQPLYRRDHPTLHTVTSCDLARPELECRSTAVLGPAGSALYVSPVALYVWTRGLDEASMVYRLPLDGSAPAALRARGTPQDQFSFLESEDGHLNVLVRSPHLDEGGRPVLGPRLLRVPLRRFGDGRGAAPPADYRALPEPGPAGPARFYNRFVGGYLLYGTSSTWWKLPGRDTLMAVRWTDGRVTPVPLTHAVDRIAPMGDHAVAVGSDTADMTFTGIRLDGAPHAMRPYVQRGARQGEALSERLVYFAEGPGRGVLAVPLRLHSRGRGVGEPVSLLFVRNENAAIHPLGQLNDDCTGSCMGSRFDNPRPIFYQGRLLALLRDEIVEGAVEGGGIRETRRVSLTPPSVRATQP